MNKWARLDVRLDTNWVKRSITKFEWLETSDQVPGDCQGASVHELGTLTAEHEVQGVRS